MKNWKVSVKILTSFAIIIFVTCIIAAIGYVGMMNMSNADNHLYNENVIAIEYIGRIATDYQEQNVLLRNLLLSQPDSEEYKQSLRQLEELEAVMEESINLYLPTIATEEDEILFNEFLFLYRGSFAEVKKSTIEATSASVSAIATESVVSLAPSSDVEIAVNLPMATATTEETLGSGDAFSPMPSATLAPPSAVDTAVDAVSSASISTDADTVSAATQAKLLLIESSTDVEGIVQSLEKCYKLNIDSAATTVKENNAIFQHYTLIQGIALAVAILIALAIAYLLTRTIATPLTNMVAAADKVAKGNVDVIFEYDASKDEVGNLATSFHRMLSTLRHQTNILANIAEGDLTDDVNKDNVEDMIGGALVNLSTSLNRVVREILTVSEQVSIGAGQVSDGSQSLAQGTSQQATAIEELSSSIFEISLNTKENAKMAEKASELYNGIKKRAQESTELMGEMMHAVDEINAAGLNISKIIKLINDISFQTNILSLNAAVEAANAGQHGKGFAVVAGEVRNLAAKSAQAAADTDALIENSIEKARLGASIAQRTQDALNQIATDILQSAQLIDDIAQSSNEQALGVEQINMGIDQVAQVINANSATAEQSAMAAEEMAAQAHSMEKMVARFRIKNQPGEVFSQETSRKVIQGASPPRQVEKPVIILEDNPDKY